ncbi:Lovastatin diketide synthase LovF [Daldinia childiae]|uniref:Lovastatin diketide synthase LovF n=1 Tax=Daldinia childiae TaxID=326645 RepID=UPI00144702E6|nr:Lovastatin diketide synthase LovF [Daldinia childiae]KAF3063606.1 Lovastatin diketide synthase LovF [Daldinia childiae]
MTISNIAPTSQQQLGNGTIPRTNDYHKSSRLLGSTNGVANGEQNAIHPIAICGMAMRLPGGVRDADTFWDVLVNKKDTRGPIPSNRYNASAFADRYGKKGAIKTQYGYFLDEDLSKLDTSFFTMSKNELERTDPQQRQLLEVIREAFENAGEADYRGRLIGCYVGTFGEDWLQISAKETQHSGGYITLHEACRALQHGDCTGAIVAGANMIMGPTTTAAMTEEGILSPEGSCKTFDAAADGFARAEAINAVYVNFLMTPSVMETRLGLSSEIPELIATCHGTGTPTGDPLETNAIGNIFGSQGVYIGSVKPNVGHSEGASGLTSLIKGVLALEHDIIPPNIKFNKPNPKIPFSSRKLRVPIEPTSWPQDRAKRISINSFGIGGSNAHIVLDANPHPVSNGPTHSESTGLKRAQLAILSANTQGSLKAYIDNLQGYVDKHPENADDIAYTFGRRREILPHRAFMIIDSNGTIVEKSTPAKAPVSNPDIVMVFSGQGAQWPEMGKELFLTDEGFRTDIMEMDRLLQSLIYTPPWSIEAELFAPPEKSKIHRAELAQPLCTAVQIALVRSLHRVGIQPAAVVGHSSGEIAAAYAAGAISLAEALISAYYRGYVTRDQTLIGGMGAVGLGVADVSKYVKGGVVIACDNSPNSVTLSGDVGALDDVLNAIKVDKPDVLARKLKVDMAYHSSHMKGLGLKYRELMEQELKRQGLGRQQASIPFFSSVKEKIIQNSDDLGPDYWIANLTSRVRFNSAVQRILEQRPRRLFVEIGPHSTLSGPLRQIVSSFGTQFQYIPTMIRGSNSAHSLASALGQLFRSGVSIDWSAVFPSGKILTDLPRYAWDHSGGSFWYEARVSKEWRFRQFGHHRLLGLHIPESSSYEPSWRNLLSLEDEPWLADHKIRSDIVFPFSGYIAMAGEAIRQITGIDAGYQVRRATARSAMVLSDHPVEVLTTLRLAKLTDTADSTWFEFSITSYSGSAWTKHCEGQIKASTNLLPPSSLTPDEDELVRKIPGSKWYDTMNNIGVVYGPEFQGLQNIVSSTTKNLAAANVSLPHHHEDPAFIFHPSGIDNCLQLALVALAKGIGRNFGDLQVPTTIEDLYISRSAATMDAVATSNGRKSIAIDCIADGKVALRLRGLELTTMDNDTTQQTEPHAAARLEWLPDFDMIDHATLFSPPRSIPEETRMQEEMTLLCMLETSDRVRGLEPCSWHFEKFRDWLELEIGRARKGTYPLLEYCREYVALSSAERKPMIEERYQQLLPLSEKGSVAIGIKRIYDNCEDIFTGKTDTLETLMQDNVLTEIYNAVSFGKGDFFKLLSHSRPNMRILEVGAGTGGTTEMILRTLVREDGHPPYSVYTFSDISAGFFPQAKERFSYAPNMDYKVFDISKSPFDQGFTAGTYDVVLASNVVHATPSLRETLLNLQPLLRPGGLLVLTELCAVVRTPNYIFGNFSGWWLGVEDDRPYEPYVSFERWDDELKASGFSGVDTALRDAAEPYHYCAAIVSTKIEDNTSSEKTPSPVSILCDDPEGDLVRLLVEDLASSSVSAKVFRLGQKLPHDQDIVSLLDLESYFFENISPERLNAFQQILQDYKSGSMIWLTRPAQVDCKDPRSAQSIGVARSIRAESSVPFYTLEISPTEPQFSTLVQKVLSKIQRIEDTDLLAPDKEYVVDAGVVKIGRYQPFSVSKELQQNTSSAVVQEAKTLETAKPGSLENVGWVGEAISSSLGDDEVVIETRAVGVNFKDVLYAMGILKTSTENVPLGHELAGIVRQVGAKVNDLVIGDRVMATPPNACFKTQVKTPASLVAKIPDNLTFEEAASMPICYTTVIESLLKIGRLEKGQASIFRVCCSSAGSNRLQSVLIHSAAGGVGHAAIQICQMVGAEIFATVGSKEKVEHLVKEFGIPTSHIFRSRDDSFVADLMRETNGRGADIVLNSLSGELLHASWDCVAEFGTLIELGERDAIEGGKLRMRNFIEHRSYSCVNMTHLAQKRSQRVGVDLKKCVELYRTGSIKPIGPLSIFDAGDVQDAFRVVQDENHIGKVVVRVPKDSSTLTSMSRRFELRFKNTASYLLTGGLGGLGKVIATWLVEKGARSLVFLSRSAGKTQQDQEFFQELRSMGCDVRAVLGRAESTEDVGSAVSQAPYPIKGVIHLAMVLRDSPIASMKHEDWVAANAPKVTGAWNLHEHLKEHVLNFFVMASSIVTIVEQPGQGNYSASNTFLEAFTQYRRSLSLPATVLNISPIDGVGFVAETPFARKNMKAQGLYFLREAELLDLFELAITQSYPFEGLSSTGNSTLTPWTSTGQLVMGLRSESDLNDPNTRTNWRRDRRMGFYHNGNEKETNTRSSFSELIAFLARVADDVEVLDDPQSVSYLSHEIGKKVYSLMLKPEDDLDISLTLSQIELDSLMAIELRRWWKQVLGLQISVLEIMATGTLEALGGVAAKGLKDKFAIN